MTFQSWSVVPLSWPASVTEQTLTRTTVAAAINRHKQSGEVAAGVQPVGYLIKTSARPPDIIFRPDLEPRIDWVDTTPKEEKPIPSLMCYPSPAPLSDRDQKGLKGPVPRPDKIQLLSRVWTPALAAGEIRGGFTLVS